MGVPPGREFFEARDTQYSHRDCVFVALSAKHNASMRETQDTTYDTRSQHYSVLFKFYEHFLKKMDRLLYIGTNRSLAEENSQSKTPESLDPTSAVVGSLPENQYTGIENAYDIAASESMAARTLAASSESGNLRPLRSTHSALSAPGALPSSDRSSKNTMPCCSYALRTSATCGATCTARSQEYRVDRKR
jgi:hypothetical protein